MNTRKFIIYLLSFTFGTLAVHQFNNYNDQSKAIMALEKDWNQTLDNSHLLQQNLISLENKVADSLKLELGSIVELLDKEFSKLSDTKSAISIWNFDRSIKNNIQDLTATHDVVRFAISRFEREVEKLK